MFILRRSLSLCLIVLLLAGCVSTDRQAALSAAPRLLPRDKIVLASTISVNITSMSAVLPLYRGTAEGRTVWHVITDSSDAADAKLRGVVHAPLLARAGHVQEVRERNGVIEFNAAPDFSANRRVQPGPQGFPPASALPGATAPAGYSPFIRLSPDGPVLNAPIVAVGDGPFIIEGHGTTLDRVLAIDTAQRRVTLQLSLGFAEGRRVLYFSSEASDPAVAALERATYVPQLGRGDGDIGLLAFLNGREQGMQTLLLKGRIAAEALPETAAGLGSPDNVLTAFPTGKTASGYSPLWSVTLLLWSDEAVAARRNSRQTDQAAIYRLYGKGLSGPDGKAVEPTGITVNCPVVAFLDEAPP
jgi:hypothetical protein